MKIRTGFVSNSSSSSFVCCLCGIQAVDHDGECEVDIFRCKKFGHEMCSDCKNESLSEKFSSITEKRNALIKSREIDIHSLYKNDSYNNNVSDVRRKEREEWQRKKREEFDLELKKLENNEFTDEQIVDMFNDFCAKDMCPVCMMVEYGRDDILSYLNKTNQIDTIKLEIKNKFNNYGNFFDYLKKK